MTEQSLSAALTEMEGLFNGLGWGRRIGFGHRPAILVADAIRAFTGRHYPQALSVDDEVEGIARLLAVARGRPFPIVFVTTGYHDPDSELGSWLERSPGLGDLKEGNAGLDPDPRLGRRSEEYLLLKKGTSAFFGTDLADWLRARQVDTCIITDFTANGCVLGTVLDSTQHGFRTAVVRDCVASRVDTLEQVVLFSLSVRADIVSLDETEDYLLNAEPA